jgi:hypothetical protein
VTGEQIAATDQMESVRQCVHQKAPDEFVGGQRHDLVLDVMPVVAPAEADSAAGERHETLVADLDAVRVAAEIGQHGGRAGEGPLGIDDPFDPAQLGEAASKDG